MLASRVDTLFQKVDQFQPTLSHGGTTSRLIGQTCICEVRGIQGHSGNECHLSNSFQDLNVEQANALYNFNNLPQNDRYSNTFGQSRRHHPNFSHKNASL